MMIERDPNSNKNKAFEKKTSQDDSNRYPENKSFSKSCKRVEISRRFRLSPRSIPSSSFHE